MSDQYSFTTIQELVLTDNVDAITSYLTRCHLEHEDHPIDPEDGRTILHLAAANGCENILSWLIKNMSVDLDVQTTETLWTPLLFAVFNGKYGAVESLLLAGADPFISDKYGDTASDLSNMTDNPNIKLLLRDHELQRLGDPNSPVTPELAAALQKRRSTMARFSIAARGGGGGNDDDDDEVSKTVTSGVSPSSRRKIKKIRAYNSKAHKERERAKMRQRYAALKSSNNDSTKVAVTSGDCPMFDEEDETVAVCDTKNVAEHLEKRKAEAVTAPPPPPPPSVPPATMTTTTSTNNNNNNNNENEEEEQAQIDWDELMRATP
eukprot:PhM_4_TR18692/c0_g1_i2/m.19164